MPTETKSKQKPRKLLGGWLSLKDAAEALGLGYDKTRGLVHAGELPAYRFSGASNGRFRIRPDDLREFVERARVRPSTPRGPGA
jgi:excisionase family DNA binding protein